MIIGREDNESNALTWVNKHTRAFTQQNNVICIKLYPLAHSPGTQ